MGYLDESSRRDIRARADELRRMDEEEAKQRKKEEQEFRKRLRKRSRERFFAENRGKFIRLGILLVILAILAGILFYLWKAYEVTEIDVTGNTMQSRDEIIGYVCTGPLGRNSLYLGYRYKDRSVTNVPFVEKMTVEDVSPHRIGITVYEKSLAGCVDFHGSYVYFSRDGTAEEISTERAAGIPEVTGLDFDHVVLHEALPVTNRKIFGQILEVSQILSKYGLTVDRLYYDGSGNLTIISGQVRAALGPDEYLDEKIANLSAILPKLEGRSGVLDLSSYDPDQKNVTFTADKNDAGYKASENGAEAVQSSGDAEPPAEDNGTVPDTENTGTPVDDTATDPDATAQTP